MANNLSFKQMSLETLFKENTNMAIPIYQRGYAWGADQVDDLWNDLMEVMEDNQDDHFFGQVVMNESEGQLFIIDGQQRLTTTVIFLAVIRDAFLKLAATDDQVSSEAEIRAKDLQNDVIGQNNHYHLTQSDAIREYFDHYIQTAGTFETAPKTKEQSLKNIHRTFLALQKNVTDELDKILTSNERLNYLKQLYKRFTQGFFVITIITQDEAAAFVIFETLNARGRDLNASDLLKNHIFRTARHNLEEVQSVWDQMMETLNNDSGVTTRFIRAYWNATEKFVTEKSLYKAIHNNITSSSDATSFTEDLASLADLFAALTEPKSNIYFDDFRLTEMLVVLKDMGGKTFYPLVLAMVKNNFSEAEVLPVLHKIYSFIVRNFTVGGLVANKYEKTFSQIAEKVNAHTLTTVAAINSEIAADMLSDDQFSEAWDHFSVKTEKVAKHILFETLYQDEQEQIDINDVKVVTLNKNIEDPDRIGNKVLVTKEEKGRLRHQKLAEFLPEAKYATTRALAAPVVLDEVLVKQRQASVKATAMSFWV